MTSFKLRNYNQLDRSISTLLSHLNETPVTAELGYYIDGIPAVDIQPEKVLQNQKADKAKAIPGAKEFQKAGVDLTLNIPNCAVSASQLDAIKERATTYASGHLHNAGRFICYSLKAGKWAINPAGFAALDAAITTLSGNEEKTYTQTVALFEHVAKNSPDLLPILFPEGKQGPRGDELNHEWLVDKIKAYTPKK